MPARSVRQHVNPLGLRYLRERAEPARRPAHLAADARVEVELGCADAKWSFEMAATHPDWWIVGLEIREAVVERNQRRARSLGLDNLTFGYVNLNVDMHRVFGPASVDRFHLLFPDPWFKRSHRKRRVVDLGLCKTLRHQLRDGGELHFASDIFELGLDALAELEAACDAGIGLANVAGPWSFARDNPVEATSKREDTTVARGQRVWRMRYCAIAASRSA